jgi:hypothetical protein
MIRRALSALALTAVLAAPAVAQSPYQVDFQFFNGGSATDYDQYTGTINGGDLFQVFCVDPTRHVVDGQVYSNAWVTPMSASNSSHVQAEFSVWNAQYLEAARIATFMTGVPNAGDPSLVHAQVLDYQHAIWTAMGYAGYDSPTVAAIRAAAASVEVFPNQWLVITSERKGYQEFITFDGDRPQETVPEPATMTLLATGLAGMAAAKRRRNRKS